MECSICFDDEVSETLSLPCGCSCCRECGLDFLSSKVAPKCFNCDKVVSLDWQMDRLASCERSTLFLAEKTFTSWKADPANVVRSCPDCTACIVSDCGKASMQFWECYCGLIFCSDCSVSKKEHKSGPKCGSKMKFILSKEEKDERQFRDWLQSEGEREHFCECPGCSAIVTRSTGCNHVQCIMCSFEFCFLCGGDYRDGAHFYESQICTDLFLSVEDYKMRLAYSKEKFVEGAQATAQSKRLSWGPLEKCEKWTTAQKVAVVAATSLLWIPLSPVIAATLGTIVAVRKIHQARVK